MSAKILVVEDHDDVRRALATRLRAAGYEVVLAADGTQAFQLARQESPGLVLLDLGLPAGDGLTVMERLRSIPALAAIPVVVVTAADRGSAPARAAAQRATAFLSKPIDNEALLETVRALLPVPAGPPAPGERPRTRKLLLVEDDADTRAGLAMRLRASGFEVAVAADAVTALMAAPREAPDVILLDLGLPGGDGLQVLARLKSHPRLTSVPVIVLSARDPAVNRDRALAAGAAAFFQKPADNAALLAALRQAAGIET